MESKTTSSLTERVLEFQRTGEDAEAIVHDVARRVYEYPRRKCRWDEDRSSEFFAHVYPKIRRMIHRFRYIGRPFESYLTSTLMFQIRSFAQAERRKDLDWDAAACPSISGAEPVAAEPSAPVADSLARGSWRDLDAPLRETLEIGPDGRIESGTARRRFLILCLKSAHVTRDADLEQISRIAVFPLGHLKDVVERLRDRGRRKLDRVELFTGRRNRAYYGLRLLEMRLTREPDPERRALLDSRRRRLVDTVRICQRVVARIRLGPTHREIAEALGIPKPTVDSTIHRLKLRAARLYACRHAESA